MSELHLNASCVAIDGRAILIEGEPGSGKSSLALALIDRGAKLIGDDGVSFEVRGDRLWASPPPRCTGKLEVRNVGLVEMPVISAPLALVILLDEAAPRVPDTIESVAFHEQVIPLIRLYPDASALPLRAERALEVHGIR